MNSEKSIATVSPEDRILAARGRAVTYAFLAVGFAHPGPELRAVLTDAEDPPDGTLGQAMRAARRSAGIQGLDTLSDGYMRLFDPRHETFMFESEHRTNHFQQRTELLADLMGFYRAFGFAADRERPDHMACELNFLHLLSLKEAWALEQGRRPAADICAEARGKFLDGHLRAWVPAFTAAVRTRGEKFGDRFYPALADLLDIALAEEEGI